MWGNLITVVMVTAHWLRLQITKTNTLSVLSMLTKACDINYHFYQTLNVLPTLKWDIDVLVLSGPSKHNLTDSPKLFAQMILLSTSEFQLIINFKLCISLIIGKWLLQFNDYFLPTVKRSKQISEVAFVEKFCKVLS